MQVQILTETKCLCEYLDTVIISGIISYGIIGKVWDTMTHDW